MEHWNIVLRNGLSIIPSFQHSIIPFETMNLRGKKVLVVGLARTGLATVEFLIKRGATVSTSEVRSEEEMKEVFQELKKYFISMEWGGHRVKNFLDQDLIILSPGVDPTLEPIQKALHQGVQVLSEMELAYQFLRVPLIAITGTNGKTTTTLLVGEMLKEEGKKVGIGGNVGEPLILFTEGGDPWEILVVEVSSFQLEGIDTFRPRCSVLLNITEDHLDRYSKYEDYIEAKVRIFKNQGPEDMAVLNGDDPIVMRYGEGVKAKKFFFSLKKKVKEGCFFNGNEVILRLNGTEEKYCLSQSPLKGVHNVENMMAAILAARLFGCSKEAIERTLGRFKGLEHRLEFVREMNGVSYYNDSKGTNVGSVVKSLQSFQEPVILIAGGKDKNTDLRPQGVHTEPCEKDDSDRRGQRAYGTGTGISNGYSHGRDDGGSCCAGSPVGEEGRSSPSLACLFEFRYVQGL